MNRIPHPSSSPEQFSQIAPYYDLLMAGVPYPSWVRYLERLIARYPPAGFVPVSPGAPYRRGLADGDRRRARIPRLVDLATGTGTVALLLATRGYRVTGVDLSAEMLAEARRKSRQQGVSVRWVRQDLSQLELPPGFQIAVCLYDSLNYLLDPDALSAVFAGVARCLVPGGVFIFDMNTIYALRLELFTQENPQEDAPIRYRWLSEWDDKTNVCTIRMEFWASEGRHLQELHRQRGYSVEEVVGRLETAGLRLQALYDAYTLWPPHSESERIFYVARSPESG